MPIDDTVSRETTLQPRWRFALQSIELAAYTDGVLDAEKLAEFIEQGRERKPASARNLLGPRKFTLESRDDAQQQRNDAGVTNRPCQSQSGGQQTTGMTLKDQQGVIHVGRNHH